MTRKIIQIATAQHAQPCGDTLSFSGGYTGPIYTPTAAVVFALCDGGTVIEKTYGEDAWRSTFLPEEAVFATQKSPDDAGLGDG